MRKNKLTGAIPGAGRKGNGVKKVAYLIDQEAANIMDGMTGNKSRFVSEAIRYYHTICNSDVTKLF